MLRRGGLREDDLTLERVENDALDDGPSGRRRLVVRDPGTDGSVVRAKLEIKRVERAAGAGRADECVLIDHKEPGRARHGHGRGRAWAAADGRVDGHVGDAGRVEWLQGCGQRSSQPLFG